MKQQSFLTEDGACEIAQGIYDIGVDAPGGFSAAKKLIEAIIGSGEVVFGQRQIGEIPFPTLDVFYDNPARVLLDEIEDDVSGRSYFYPNMLFHETGGISKAKCQCAPAVFARPQSLVAAVHSASLAVPLIVSKLLLCGILPDQIVWAWSTAPIPVMADDEALMRQRARTARKAGAVVSLWLRAQDSDIEKAAKAADECAQLCIHNLATAKTTVIGEPDEAQLRNCFLN